MNRFKCYTIKTPGVLLFKGKWECISNLKTLLSALPTRSLNHTSPVVQKIYEEFNLSFPKY